MLGGMKKIMEQAQELQKKVQSAQGELAKKEFTVSVGGDMVTAVITGNMQFQQIRVSQEALDLNDLEMLQDMLCAAVNQAVAKVTEEAGNTMKEAAGGLNIPGLRL